MASGNRVECRQVINRQLRLRRREAAGVVVVNINQPAARVVFIQRNSPNAVFLPQEPAILIVAELLVSEWRMIVDSGDAVHVVVGEGYSRPICWPLNLCFIYTSSARLLCCFRTRASKTTYSLTFHPVPPRETRSSMRSLLAAGLRLHFLVLRLSRFLLAFQHHRKTR